MRMKHRNVSQRCRHMAGGRKILSAAILAAILGVVGVTPALAQSSTSGTSPAGNAADQTPTIVTAEDVANLEPMSPGFTSMELAEATLEQLPVCLEYKITGITLRVIITPWFVYYFWTPHVEHYSPDLLAMSHAELNAMPWVEYNALFGEAYKQVSNVLFAKILSTLFGLPQTEIGGGRYLDKGWGKHQAVQFTESTIVGNPVAMFIDAFTFKGINLPQPADNSNQNTKRSNPSDEKQSGNKSGGNRGGRTPSVGGQSSGNGNGGPQVPTDTVKNWLSSWANGNTNWLPIFSQNLGYTQVMMMMANSPVVQSIKQLMQQIDAALSSINGKVGDSPFCPVNATPFEPYYLSGLDAYAWRLGYPVADPDKSLTILNPLSRDKIAPSSEEDFGKVLFNLPPELVKFLTPRWGHVYPREGALDQPDTSKHGAVVAERGRSLLAESKKPLNRIYRIPKYIMNGAAWSKMHPVQTICHRNIANTGADIEKHSRYAWTLWTSHDCDLFRHGIPIVTVPIGPIYVTPAIPE